MESRAISHAITLSFEMVSLEGYLDLEVLPSLVKR
jgi:hypothetical protein